MKVSCVSLGKNYNGTAFGELSNIRKTESRNLVKNLGSSVCVGLTAGALTAGVLKAKKMPNVFINALEIGTVCSYVTYIGSLLLTPFKCSSSNTY